MTVVIITHYMEEAALADRCVVMEKGHVLCDGTPAEVFARRELLEKTGLTLPVACRLAYMLADGGLKLPRLPLTEEECVELISQTL